MISIKTENLTYTVKHWTGKNINILDNINTEIRSAEITLILGDSGSGKTILAQNMAGILNPTTGKRIINGFESPGKKHSNVNSGVGYVFQYPENQLFMKSVYEDIVFALNKKYDKKIIKEKLDDMLAMVNLSKDVLNKSIYEISNTQKKKVAMAGVLINNPDIVFFDEPLKGFSYNEKRFFIDLLIDMKNNQNKTLVVITHELDGLLEISDKVIFVKNGVNVFDGAVSEFINSKFVENYMSDEIYKIRKYLSYINGVEEERYNDIFTVTQAIKCARGGKYERDCKLW